MKNGNLTLEEFFSLFSSIFISRNMGCLDMLSFYMFVLQCNEEGKYFDLLNLREPNLALFFQQLRTIYNKLNRDKKIFSYYSEFDNHIYIFQNDYINIIKEYIDYFSDVSDFINDFITYQYKMMYGINDEQINCRVIS